MIDIAIRVQGAQVRLRIPEREVFVPNLVGLLDATQLRVRPGEVVCDVGTGSGFHAILAAKLGAALVYGIDIHPRAVSAARRNARLNGVSGRCRFLEGSFEEMLRRLDRPVDLMISTLPNTPEGGPGMREILRRASPSLSRHLGGGADGAELNVRLIRAASAVLSPDGRIHTHLVEWSDSSRILRELRERKFRVHTLRRAFIPKWGQRCNAPREYMARAGRGPWRVRYPELPPKRGCLVRSVAAVRGTSWAPRESRPAEATIRWRSGIGI